jgi:hypothetical protein
MGVLIRRGTLFGKITFVGEPVGPNTIHILTEAHTHQTGRESSRFAGGGDAAGGGTAVHRTCASPSSAKYINSWTFPEQSCHSGNAGGCNRDLANREKRGLGLQTRASYKEEREAPSMGSAYQVECTSHAE